MAKFNKTAQTAMVAGVAIVATIVGGIAIHKGIVHQQKVSQCEASEALIVEQLNAMKGYDLMVVQRMQHIDKMMSDAEDGGLVGWMTLGPKIQSAQFELDSLQDKVDAVTAVNYQTSELYRNGTTCKLSQEYREKQWNSKFVPIVKQRPLDISVGH